MHVFSIICSLFKLSRYFTSNSFDRSRCALKKTITNSADNARKVHMCLYYDYYLCFCTYKYRQLSTLEKQ